MFSKYCESKKIKTTYILERKEYAVNAIGLIIAALSMLVQGKETRPVLLCAVQCKPCTGCSTKVAAPTGAENFFPLCFFLLSSSFSEFLCPRMK